MTVTAIGSYSPSARRLAREKREKMTCSPFTFNRALDRRFTTERLACRPARSEDARMNKRNDQADAEPGRKHHRDDGDVARPGDRIGEADRRVGRKIKREQPAGDEPGYANHDNVPDR